MGAIAGLKIYVPQKAIDILPLGLLVTDLSVVFVPTKDVQIKYYESKVNIINQNVFMINC